METEHRNALRRLHITKGELNYLLEVFGSELSARHNYRGIDGMSAIHLYLINKHHWLPRDVRSMSQDDLQLALHEEMQDWTAPPDTP